MQVAAGSAGRLQVTGLEVTNPGINPLGAVRVSSDRPISVAEIESDDGSQAATSSSGTVVLPLQWLGSRYRAVMYPQEATYDVQPAVGARRRCAGDRRRDPARHPDQLQARGEYSGDPGPGQLVPPLAAGEPLEVTLNDGDVFRIYTNAADEDLTGNLVTVLSGAPWRCSGVTSTSDDRMLAASTPRIWRTNRCRRCGAGAALVAAPLAPQSSIGCTSFFADGQGVSGGSMAAVAGEDDTRVDFSPSPEHVWLRAGQSVTRVSSAPFTVTATRPVLVTQGMHCEPSLSLAISADPNALLTNVSFAALPVFDQLVAIVRQSGASPASGRPAVSDSMFQPIDSHFEFAELPSPLAGRPRALACTACPRRAAVSG